MSETADGVILLVEDDIGIAELVREALSEDGLALAHVQRSRAALDWLAHNRPQLVLLDYSLPDSTADQLIRQVGDMPPFIVITGAGDERVAVAMMKQGARDYLVKDRDFLITLPLVVRQILKQIATERQLIETEQALLESEKQYRTLSDNSPDNIVRMDRSFRIILANRPVRQSLAHTLQIPEMAIIGKTYRQLGLPDEQCAFWERQIQTVLDTASSLTTTYSLDGPDGQHTFECTLIPELDQLGHPQSVLTQSHDITERKKQEDALTFMAECGMRPGEDFFQSLAKYLAETLRMDYICIDRLEGKKQSALTIAVYYNGNFEDNLSYTLKDTPCAEVVEKTICTFPAGVRHLFPKDTLLQEMQAESYAGITLWSSAGEAIGLIAVIGRRPLESSEMVETLLKLIAVRAAGELERLRAEELIRTALAEKEVLLRELYHRTKNNMQVISALLNLESDKYDDSDIQKTLLDMDARIRSIALVHEKLYQSKNLSSLDLKEYVTELANLIVRTYQLTHSQVSVFVESLPIPVIMDTAIPCGLIVNEILSNALKYAFLDGRKGAIRIQMNKTDTGQISINIADNGIGAPSDKDFRRSQTLGMQVIFGIAAHQLNATVDLDTHNGFAWQICFSDNQYEPRV